MFPYKSIYVNHGTVGAVSFLDPVPCLNELGRGPLGDASYQIS